ncbi:MAG: glycoside hydrolase family 3 protein [Clostridia bacterium]|nr:glycoside hydrolase family 3 protein [Clostridia bacterium]
MRQGTTIFLSVIMTFFLFAGCSSNNKGIADNDTSIAQEDGNKKESSSNAILPRNTDIAEKLFENMTLEEKVGQIFIMSLRNFERYPQIIEMNQDVMKRIKDNHLGGVILFAENITTIPQTKKLIADVKAASKIPLFMAVDEEGGATSRLGKKPLMHSTRLPDSAVIGRAGDRELAEKAGALIAREIFSIGFNMNFAPVADVNTNPENPVIGNRAFGDNPEVVAEMIKAEVQGMQKQNVIAVLKHFPGHGDTSTDTHTGAVIIEHDRERLDRIELYPFKVGIENGIQAIMTAHIQLPKIIKSEMPATLSKEILTDLLRNDMKFEGLIITDALEMGAISERWGPAEASILAFEAGTDILLMPLSIEEAYKGMLSAVKNGRITEERLNESVKRILKIKQKWGILDNIESGLDPEQVLGCEEHLKISREILEKVARINR